MEAGKFSGKKWKRSRYIVSVSEAHMTEIARRVNGRHVLRTLSGESVEGYQGVRTYIIRRVRGRLDDRHVLRTLSGEYE
jgi:hypothetical protein